MSKSGAGVFLRRLRNRIWLGQAADVMSGALLASAAGFFLLAVSRHVVVMPYPLGKAAYLLAALWLFALALALAGRPGLRRAALEGDRLGLQGRLSTHLEFGDGGGAVMEAFRDEMEDTLAGVTPARLYPIKFPGRRVMAAAVIMLIASSIFYIPSPRLEETAAVEEVNRELRREAENIARWKDALGREAEDAGENDPAGALSLLEELERGLRQSFDYREAALMVADTLHEIAGTGQSPAAGVKGLAGIFAGAGEKTAAAAALLKNGEAGAAASLLEDMRFDRRERQIMLENTAGLLDDPARSGAERQILQRVKAALEQESPSGRELSRALQAAAPAREVTPGRREAEIGLQSMKERLLARGGRFGDSGAPDTGGELLEEGELGELRAGEITNLEATSVVGGEYGSQPRRNSGALGGGVPGGGAGGEGSAGRVEQSREPVFAGGADPVSLEVGGTLQEESGGFSQRPSDSVIGLAGESSPYGPLYREFQREGMAYVDRLAIPPGKGPLVLEYFRELRGEQ